ncbi:MAG TPA: MerR family transcriptional regulator [Ignavibacteriaceae bacterium]|nr:MerR family transcriptional regulator [Ignavibacteriaceae bacterium]
MNNDDTPLFTISLAAQILHISVHTLRMYEKEGLIIPFRKESGHRLYSDSDIKRLKCIRESINERKISIEGIKTIYSFIPCWTITGCSKKDRSKCEAFTNHSNPCWSFHNEKNICLGHGCRNCIVYKNFSDCKSIKENIAKLTT